MTKNEALQLAAIILSGNEAVSKIGYKHKMAEHLFDLAEAILAEHEKRSPAPTFKQTPFP